MKKPSMTKYANGVGFREHNKHTLILIEEEADSYLVEITRVLQQGEIADDFVSNPYQELVTRAGIQVLVSRVRMTRRGLLALEAVIGVLFKQMQSVRFEYNPAIS
jgi:hypothetical protein